MSRPDPVRAIADAVLYEGYVLWPYRRSALKNQRRWTFGGIHPPAHTLRHPDDRDEIRAQVLVEGDREARVSVSVRFLQVVKRQVVRRTPSGPEPVEELVVDGERHLSWDEARERQVGISGVSLAALRRSPRLVPIEFGGGGQVEQLGPAGALVRSWRPLAGDLAVGAEPLRAGLHRLSVGVANATEWEGLGREEALRQTLCSAHAVLRVEGGAFVSSVDPPAELAAPAAACAHDGVWPVLVGEPGRNEAMLLSPIILEDYARVAPESPGDLFDGGEIDQLLVLNILALSDEEKAEVRGTDPRAREILERTEALSDEQLRRLHGRVRGLGLAEGA